MKAGGLLNRCLLLPIKAIPSYTNKPQDENTCRLAIKLALGCILTKKIAGETGVYKNQDGKARDMGNWFLFGGSRKPQLSMIREEAHYCS